MPANKGNEYWKSRKKHGPNSKFETKDALWKACKNYFNWVTETPLKEERVFHAQGVITKTTVKKMRAMTIKGLCLYLGISNKTWQRYCGLEDLRAICDRVLNIIYVSKFEGAAANLLNPVIIARELGLKDHSEIEKSITHTNVKNIKKPTRKELIAIINNTNTKEESNDNTN